MPSMTIAVHGATGSQGAPVAALLTAAGHDVRPVSRASGADLLDRASLEAAYAGADAVVLQLPLVYDARALTMGHNAARAAEAAGVRHLVVNTGGPFGHEPIGVPYVDARHRAASADVPLVTLLQPTTYLENLSAPWSTVRDGVVAYPRPAEAVVQWVATEDVARAAVQVLEERIGGRFDLPGRGARRAPSWPRRWRGARAAGPLRGDHARRVRRAHCGRTSATTRRSAPRPSTRCSRSTRRRSRPPSELRGWAPRSVEPGRDAFACARRPLHTAVYRGWPRYTRYTARLVDSRRVLGTSSTETWDAFFSDFYLRAYADEERDAQAEADALAAARLAGVEPGADVLDVPCGFGRHTLALARAGYRVGRRGPLAAAARRGPAPRRRRALAEADPRRLPRAAVRRGAASTPPSTSSPRSATSATRRTSRCWRAIRRVLRPGAKLVLEIDAPRPAGRGLDATTTGG